MFLFFKEDIDSPVHQFFVMFRGDSFLQFFNHTEAAPLFLITYVIRHRALGKRPGTRRIAGQMDDVEFEIAELLNSFFEL